MSSETMTIAEMLSHPLTSNIFPDNYPFYVDDEKARKEFEEKFIAYFYYRQIGYETPFMFKQRLNTLLMIRMPYWKQLYETELEAKDINFLLNKDLKETFLREIESENAISGTNSTNQSNNSTNSIESEQTLAGTNSGTQSTTSENTTSGTSSNTHKESSLGDGVAQASLTDGYLTATSEDNGTSSQNSNGTQSSKTSDETNTTQTNSGTSTTSDTSESSGTNNQTENGKTLEKTELISQGNIGITSSAQLLKEWRQVLINMDEIIINECKQLFLKIY